MKSTDDIKKFFKRAAIGTDPAMDETVLDKVLVAHERTTNTQSAVMQPKIRRTVMKSPITKLAAAAVVLIAVLVGISLLDSSATSVAWSEVARKVEASRGLSVRSAESIEFAGENYSVKYFCPTHSRMDTYLGGQITDSYYTDFEAKTYTCVHHIPKHYLSITITPSKGGFLEKNEDWMDPRYLVQTILSCEHKELGQKTIDGVPCEGLETMDPAIFGPLPGPVSRLDVQFRLWVNAETQYPFLFEWKVNAEAEGQVIANEGIMHQFQWDVDLDPEIFEPNIPPDYEDMRNL